MTDTVLKGKYESKRSIKFELIDVSRNKKSFRYDDCLWLLFNKSESTKCKDDLFKIF